MIGTELRVQASVWKHCRVRERHDGGGVSGAVVGHRAATARHGSLGDRWHVHIGHNGNRPHDADLAVLAMEGETADHATDVLYQAVLARGLALTTDLDHLGLRPVPGWRVVVDEAGAVTLEWPHAHPLLDTVPLDLPAGWLRAAAGMGVVVVVAGYGLHLSASAPDPLAARLERAASTGALAAGGVASTLPE